MRLSILVPVFNEENTILNILEEIKAQNLILLNMKLSLLMMGLLTTHMIA